MHVNLESRWHFSFCRSKSTGSVAQSQVRGPAQACTKLSKCLPAGTMRHTEGKGSRDQISPSCTVIFLYYKCRQLNKGPTSLSQMQPLLFHHRSSSSRGSSVCFLLFVCTRTLSISRIGYSVLLVGPQTGTQEAQRQEVH